MPIAVLSGDIVASTALPRQRLDDVMSALATAAGDMSTWHGAELRFTRQRGDGWQVVLAQPVRALRSALYMQSAIRALGKGITTRISIATGAGGPGSGPDLNSATDAVFVAAGRGLDSMTGPERMRHASGGAIGAATRLADLIAQEWTAAQARALHPMLVPGDPPRHADVAQRLGITRQAVTQALAAAGFDALDAALRLIEQEDAAG
ncbi:MarR family transcriptional regulator [Tropicimonas sp.]|uniref:MarR family transcriptional regulator n=1 Tax=Tropicimonas sp. TaxID=2067044 RepID=UPI003A8B712C